MLWKVLQQLPAFIFSILMVGVVIAGAYTSTQKSLTFPSEQEIGAIGNVGGSLPASERQAVILSRSSTVQVMSADLSDGGISMLTGTYITLGDNYFVLTASHGVYELCAFTQIVVGEKTYDCKGYTLRGKKADYIVIQVDQISNRTPVRIPHDIPHQNEWISELATQNTIYYTGYPNHGGPYTFDGKVVAYSEDEAIFIDSYGWSGSSGAGVFSESGNLIGWIMALEVGESYLGRQVLENFIWVIPLFIIDWPAVDAFAN